MSLFSEQSYSPELKEAQWAQTIKESEAMIEGMAGTAAHVYRYDSMEHGYIDYATVGHSSPNRISILYDKQGNPLTRRILTARGSPQITLFKPWGETNLTFYKGGNLVVDALPQQKNEHDMWQQIFISARYLEGGYLEKVKFSGDFGIKSDRLPILELYADMFTLPMCRPSYFQDKRHTNILYDYTMDQGKATNGGVSCMINDMMGNPVFEMSYQIGENNVVSFAQTHIQTGVSHSINTPMYLDMALAREVANLDFFADLDARIVSDLNWSDIPIFLPVEMTVQSANTE